MQLDLFLDSRAVMLANDVIGALAARDPERARAVLGHLHSEAPEYPGIDAFERLRELLELEKQGFSQPLVAGRARLRELNREIFALYMANRTIQRR